MTRRVVAGDHVDLLDAVLDRPLGERHHVLRDRHADAHVIGRAAGDRRGRGIHDDDGNLGLLGDVGNRHGVRRQVEACEHLHFFAEHQFFRELLGLVRTLAGGIAIDELDLVFPCRPGPSRSCRVTAW